MLKSVRARLTLWHTLVLAVLLALFVWAAYAFVVRTSRARTDAAVLDAVGHLRAALLSERPRQPTTADAARQVLAGLHFRKIAFVVFDSTGRAVAVSLTRPELEPDEEPSLSLDTARLARDARAFGPAEPQVVALPDREGGYRAALASANLPEGRFVVAAVVSLYDEEETLADARRAMFVAIPLALLLAGLSGWMLARRSLEPMITMRERTARIGATNLGERVPIANAADEVGQLATVINDLLGRLEQAFAQQRQFMADASHELRTPVAVIQHEASLALSRSDRSAAEYEDSLSIVRDAGRRMRLIVDDLLLLASADAGEVPMRRAPLYLEEVVADCARTVRALASARDVSLTLTLPDEAPFVGDEALLHRLVLNLVDNALKHSPAGASVTLHLGTDTSGYRLEVADTGSGIPLKLQPRIFERFVRADEARPYSDSNASGAGLGLSIARWIAEAHGGQLDLLRSSSAGSVFVLTLPADDAQTGHE